MGHFHSECSESFGKANQPLRRKDFSKPGVSLCDLVALWQFDPQQIGAYAFGAQVRCAKSGFSGLGINK